MPVQSRRTQKQRGGYIVLVSDLSAHRGERASDPAAKQDTIWKAEMDSFGIYCLRPTLTAKIARFGTQKKIGK
jgi:hypothetical protein